MGNLGGASNGRRTEQRYPIRLPVVVTIKDPKTGAHISYDGHTLNISSTGLTFVTHEDTRFLSVAELLLHPPSPLEPFSMQGWLTWEDEKNGIYGVHFSDPSPSLKDLAQTLAKNGLPTDRRLEQRRQVAPRERAERREHEERRAQSTKRTSKTEFSMFDRRSTLRVQTDLPMWVLSSDGKRVSGVLESFSEHGICFRVDQELEKVSPIQALLKLSSDAEQTFPIELTWHYLLKKSHRYGAKFSKPTSANLGHIREYLVKALKTPGSVTDRRLRSTIISELVSYPNRDGEKIVGYHDHRVAASYKDDPLVIIPSAYAETKKDALHTSYYLVANGFQVLRYDNTHHTGESDGDILTITLSRFKNDILSSVDYAEKNLGAQKIGIVSLSLSARTAIKATAQDHRVKFLLGLVTAVDVQRTLAAVYCEDLVGTYKSGKLWGITNVLGCNTYLDDFLQDVIDSGYEDVNTTLSDVSSFKIPFVLLATEQDPWVRFEDVQSVFSACPSKNKEIHLIPAMHQLKENPKAAQAAFRLIVSSAVKYLMGKDCKPLSVIEPSMRWLAVQNRIERQRMRLFSSFEKKSNQAFWTQYLDQFQFVNELPDYRQLLQSQYESMHGLHPGEKILDAGCGNGTFGLWVLTNLALQSKSNPSVLASTFEKPIEFQCIDYVREALDFSKTNHQTLQKQLFGDQRREPVHFRYQVADLEHPLPFPNQTFDKISSNLVISYLKDPISTIKEFIRVTKPGGTIVVSTLKPYADTSQIYRNFVQTAPGDQRVEQTRKLLNNAGDIRLKETEGHFTFFSDEELIKMARTAGAENADVARSFGNQANVLIINV